MAKKLEWVELTGREEEIVRLISLGCTNGEMAAILKIAISTVDNHRTRLMKKFGADKAALLTRLAIKFGYTTLDDKLTATERRRSGRKHDGWN